MRGIWRKSQQLSRGRNLLGVVQKRSLVFTFRKDEENLYTLLKVKTTASPKEIKFAYYKLAK